MSFYYKILAAKIQKFGKKAHDFEDYPHES